MSKDLAKLERTKQRAAKLKNCPTNRPESSETKNEDDNSLAEIQYYKVGVHLTVVSLLAFLYSF